MNTFGRMFRLTLFGESHGKQIGVILDGCPAGLAIDQQDFIADLDRRRASKKGTTPRKESDLAQIQNGIFNGRTTGAPICITFENADKDSSAYDQFVNTPRPGHADWVARQKYGGFSDHRGGGPFSGRLTLGLVCCGVIAKKLMPAIQFHTRLMSVGGSTDIDGSVSRALDQNNSVGGLIECSVTGLPAGLGEPFFNSVESLIAHMVYSIGGVRGIEFGAGFQSAAMFGSQCNDPIIDQSGKTSSNHAGGVNGGITNGNPLVLRVAIKPTSSIGQTQTTVDLSSGQQTQLIISGRHDACIAVRAAVVIEAGVACVLADLMLQEHKIQRVC